MSQIFIFAVVGLITLPLAVIAIAQLNLVQVGKLRAEAKAERAASGNKVPETELVTDLEKQMQLLAKLGLKVGSPDPVMLRLMAAIKDTTDYDQVDKIYTPSNSPATDKSKSA